MAGHNKWTQIKRKKDVADQKRSKVFTVLAKTIAKESKIAGGDKTRTNLKQAIEKARAENMPNENIERAIQKGIGAGGTEYLEVLYEAFGPGGVAILIQASTDNNNRTNQEIKHLLSESGATLGVQGSAQWAFTKTKEGWHPTNTTPLSDEDAALFTTLVEALLSHDDVENIYTSREGYEYISEDNESSGN